MSRRVVRTAQTQRLEERDAAMWPRSCDGSHSGPKMAVWAANGNGKVHLHTGRRREPDRHIARIAGRLWPKLEHQPGPDPRPNKGVGRVGSRAKPPRATQVKRQVMPDLLDERRRLDSACLGKPDLTLLGVKSITAALSSLLT